MYLCSMVMHSNGFVHQWYKYMCAVSPNHQPLQICFCSALIHCYPFEGFIHLIRSITLHTNQTFSILSQETSSEGKKYRWICDFSSAQPTLTVKIKSHFVDIFFLCFFISWLVIVHREFYLNWVIDLIFQTKKKKCVLSEET